MYFCIHALMAFQLIVLLSGLGSEFIVLLASERYLDGAVVIPYLIAGMMVSGVVAILYFALKFLIPDYGVEGAGMATLSSLLLLVIFIYHVSRCNFDDVR